MTDRVTMRQRLRLRSHTRSIAVYAFLVGLPVLALLGVLQQGRQLQAPPAVDGFWQIDQGAACGLAAGDRFEIVQSGQYVAVSLEDREPLRGRLNDGVLRARGGARESFAPGCSEGQLELAFRLGPDNGRLTGTGGFEGCSACPPRPIRAVRTTAR